MKSWKVFLRHRLIAENDEAVEEGRARSLDPDVLLGLPDERFPIALGVPMGNGVVRCLIVLYPDGTTCEIDVSEDTYNNLPSVLENHELTP